VKDGVLTFATLGFSATSSTRLSGIVLLPSPSAEFGGKLSNFGKQVCNLLRNKLSEINATTSSCVHVLRWYACEKQATKPLL
jgi:hypothetical protein